MHKDLGERLDLLLVDGRRLRRHHCERVAVVPDLCHLESEAKGSIAEALVVVLGGRAVPDAHLEVHGVRGFVKQRFHDLLDRERDELRDVASKAHDELIARPEFRHEVDACLATYLALGQHQNPASGFTDQPLEKLVAMRVVERSPAAVGSEKSGAANWRTGEPEHVET
ncbi:MAG: hypothetical protein WC683_16840 [bacterium]